MIGFKRFITTRPLAFLSIVGGIRDFVLGLAFIFAWEEIENTRLFKNYDEFLPGYSGWIIGFIMMITGAVVIATALTKRIRTARVGLDIQSAVWAFSVWMYAINGDFLFAIIFAGFFCIPAAYISYYYKYGNLHGLVDKKH